MEDYTRTFRKYPDRHLELPSSHCGIASGFPPSRPTVEGESQGESEGERWREKVRRKDS